jgi:hypothetical protein
MTMDEPEKRIAELQSKTEQTNYEFVRTELDCCFSAVERGIADVESGNRESAQEESQKAEKGYKTVVGFVAELGDQGQQAEVVERWNTLRSRFDTLQTMLKNSAPE